MANAPSLKSDSSRENTIATSGDTLKICLISPYPLQEGGISEYCKDLAQELAKRAKVVVLAQREETAPSGTTVEDGVFITRLWRRNSVLAPFRLFRAVMRTRPQVVHLQYESYGLYGTFDFLTTPLTLVFLKIAGLRTCVTLHSFIESPRQRSLDLDYVRATTLGRVSKYLYQVLRVTVRLSLRLLGVRIIVHSESLGARLRLLGFRPERLAVIPIGAARVGGQVERSEAKRRLGIGTDRVILSFGLVSAAKRISDLVTAFQQVSLRIPSCTLIVSGAPSAFDPAARSYYNELRELAKWTNRVVFIDRYVSREEVGVIFSSADVFVMTYSIQQGSSASLALALAYGLPIIVPEGGTSAADAKTNGFGLVYSREDSNSLAQRIIFLLSDDGFLQEFSAKAKRTASSRTWAAIAEKTLAFYGARIPSKRSSPAPE